MANPDPKTEQLNPLGSGKLSPEEEYQIRAAGGRAAAAVVKQKRYAEKVKEDFQKLLNLPYRPGELEEIASLQDLNKNTTVAQKLYMKLIRDYLETGNPRLLELIMRYSGSNDEPLRPEEAQDQQENSLVAALEKQAEEVWKDEVKTE